MWNVYTPTELIVSAVKLIDYWLKWISMHNSDSAPCHSEAQINQVKWSGRGLWSPETNITRATDQTSKYRLSIFTVIEREVNSVSALKSLNPFFFSEFHSNPVIQSTDGAQCWAETKGMIFPFNAKSSLCYTVLLPVSITLRWRGRKWRACIWLALSDLYTAADQIQLCSTLVTQNARHQALAPTNRI